METFLYVTVSNYQYMSLEDSGKLPQDRFEMGGIICRLPPGKINLVTQEYYEMNDGDDDMYYYVQYISANVLHGEREKIIIHRVPGSKIKELKPE